MEIDMSLAGRKGRLADGKTPSADLPHEQTKNTNQIDKKMMHDIIIWYTKFTG